MNQCGACRADFSSLEIFDRHRVGECEYEGEGFRWGEGAFTPTARYVRP